MKDDPILYWEMYEIEAQKREQFLEHDLLVRHVLSSKGSEVQDGFVRLMDFLSELVGRLSSNGETDEAAQRYKQG
jgi:hypothetical protein